MSRQPSVPDPSSPQGGVAADLITRFLARLIDGILLAIVNSLVVGTVILGTIFGVNTTGMSMSRLGGLGFAGLLSSTVTALIALAYFAYLESSRGQTIGKMLVRIEVRGPDGGRPSVDAAVRRNLWLLLSIVPFIGNLAQLIVAVLIAASINNNPANLGWHDGFAGGTQVVRLA